MNKPIKRPEILKTYKNAEGRQVEVHAISDVHVVVRHYGNDGFRIETHGREAFAMEYMNHE